jgi:hypothetical protein
MSKRFKTHGGLIWWNHIKKEIHVTRSLNPPTNHARFMRTLRVENPEYTLVEDWLK